MKSPSPKPIVDPVAVAEATAETAVKQSETTVATTEAIIGGGVTDPNVAAAHAEKIVHHTDSVVHHTEPVIVAADAKIVSADEHMQSLPPVAAPTPVVTPTAPLA